MLLFILPKFVNLIKEVIMIRKLALIVALIFGCLSLGVSVSSTDIVSEAAAHGGNMR